MTKDDIDKLWNQAMTDAIKNGEDFTRYRFAALVAKHEREECAEEAECIEAYYDDSRGIAKAIRARGNT
jgi:hypothetical protein